MKLALFFTRGISLKIWEKVGNLNREIKLYKELTQYFDEIFFLTYESNDLEYNNLFSENIFFTSCPRLLKIFNSTSLKTSK